MIQPVKHNAKHTMLGDILYGEEWVKSLVENPKASEHLPERFVPLINYTGNNTWNNLNGLGISVEKLEEDFKYNCPFINGNKPYWFLPVLLFVHQESSKSYFDNFCNKAEAKALFDHDYWKFFLESSGSDDISRLFNTKIAQSFLGHGYTHGTLPSDGHGEKMYATIKLDNGDDLFGPIWVWHNK